MRILAEMPSWKSAIVATLVCMALSPLALRATVSLPVPVMRNPEQSYLWRTAPSGAFDLRWVKPQGATSATLAVTGAGYSQTYENLTGESLQLSLPGAASPVDENVYELVLTFDNASTLRTTLGAVSTIGTASAAASALDDTSREWTCIVRPAVLPIPYGVERFEVDGVPTDTGLGGHAGWYLFQAAHADTHTLLAATSTALFEAEVTEVRGMTIIIR